jgi:hypothetical protein
VGEKVCFISQVLVAGQNLSQREYSPMRLLLEDIDTSPFCLLQVLIGDGGR